MSWTITIADDADTTGEKTITGIWTDIDSNHPFSLRCRPDAKGQDAFIQAAIKNRDAWQAKITAEKDFVAGCLSKLNTADPKISVEVK